MVTLFITPECGACTKAVSEVSRLFARWRKPLVIRMPSPEEAKLLPAEYPVLHLPKTGPPLMLVGSRMADVIRDRPELVDCNGMYPEPARG